MVLGMGPSKLIETFRFFASARHPHQRSQFRDAAKRRIGDSLDLQLSGLDLREIENVVDDVQQIVGVPSNRLGGLDTLSIVNIVPENIGVAEDGGHGRADFMAHVCQEFTLHAIGRFGFLVGFLEGFVAGLQFGRVELELFLGLLAIADVGDCQQRDDERR